MSQTTSKPQDQNQDEGNEGIGDKAAKFVMMMGEDIRVGMKDTFSKVTENDVNRRIEKFRLVLATIKDDSRFETLFSKGEISEKDLVGQLEQAKKGTGNSKFVASYKAVGEATDKLEKDISDLWTAEEAGLKFATKSNKKTEQTLLKIDDHLAKGKMTEQERAGFLNEAKSARNMMIAVGKAKSNDRANVLENADKTANGLLSRIEEKLNEHEKLSKPLLDEHKRLGDLLARVEDNPATAKERVAVSVLLRAANDLIFLCKYSEVEKKLTEAENALKVLNPKPPSSGEDLKKRAEALKKNWFGYAKTLDDAQKQKPNLSKEVKADVEEMRKRAAALFLNWDFSGQGTVAMMLKQAGTEVQVGKMLTAFEAELKTAQGLIKVAVGMVSGQAAPKDPSLTDPIAEIDRRFAETKKEAEELYKTISGDNKPEELLDQLEEIKQRWSKTCAKAVLPADLLIPNYIREIEGIERAIAGKRGLIKSGGLKKVDVAFEVKVKAYRDGFKALTTAANTALGSDAKLAIEKGLASKPAMQELAAETLISQHQKARGDDKAVEARTASLEKIVQEIARLKGEAEKIKGVDDNALEQQRTKCREAGKKIEESIKSVEDFVKDKFLMGAATKKDLNDYAKSLREELATALAPIEAKDMSILKTVESDLTALQKRLREFTALAKGKKEKGVVTPPSFDEVKKEIVSVKGELDKGIFASRTATIKPLVDEHNDISDNATKYDPAESMKTLGEIRQKVKAAALIATSEHEAAKKALKELKTLLAAVNDTTNKGLTGGGGVDEKYEKYVVGLVFRIRQFREQVKADDKFDGNDRKLADALKAEWNNAYDVMKAQPLGRNETQEQRNQKTDKLNKAVTEADDEDAKVKETQERFISLREVEVKVLMYTAESMDKEEAKSLKKQIGLAQSQITSGLKDLKEKRDVDAATALIDSLTLRLQRMQESPLGSATRMRDSMPKVVDDWKKAVDLMHNNIGEIAKSVAGECTQNDEKEAAGKLVAIETELKGLFVKEAFDNVLKAMTDGKPAAKTIAAAKEDGLREVRRIEKFMAANPKMRLVTGKAYPFKAPLLPVQQAGAALFNLKTNLMISG
jgi:hypothetical protein